MIDLQTAAMLIGCAAIFAVIAAVGGPIAAGVILVCGIALGVALIHFQK